MKISKPIPDQAFNLSETFAIEGTVDPQVIRIKLVVDGKFNLPDPTLKDGTWSLLKRFNQPGDRKIEATGLDIAGKVVATATVKITLRDSELEGYQPPSASLSQLGSIVQLLESATRIHKSFEKGGKIILKLAGGEIYYDSLLDLDSDGSIYNTDDQTGQSDTTLHQPDGSPVDADAVPFFVLPGIGFYQKFGIKLGDIASVIYQDHVEFAVFVDHGPSKKLGEGSIALHRALGHETIRGGKFHDEALDEDVITIVFPGSGDGTPQTPEKIRQIGRKLFKDLAD